MNKSTIYKHTFIEIITIVCAFNINFVQEMISIKLGLRKNMEIMDQQAFTKSNQL